MESANPKIVLPQPKVTIKFANLRVVEVRPGTISCLLDKYYINLHVQQIPHLVKVGDFIPLFTEIPLAQVKN